MKLFFCWMTWSLSILAMANIHPQASNRLDFYPRSLEDGLLFARAPSRQSRSPDPMQRSHNINPQVQGSSAAVRESNSPSSRNAHIGRWRNLNSSDSSSWPSSHASSRSLSRSSSPSNSHDPDLPSPIVYGFAVPPFKVRYTKDGRPTPTTQFSDGPLRQISMLGHQQAAVNLQTMRDQQTGATGRAILIASGHHLARTTVNTHDGGTGFIQPDLQTRPYSPERFVPSRTIDTTRIERQNPMREMSVAAQVDGPGEITAEGKNPGAPPYRESF